ncbi:MAG: hypothetical protein M1836_000321 [Candelina mexicana]|nr:MAG: hypothetical protein M1836_000321 [Candelina mexicana]
MKDLQGELLALTTKGTGADLQILTGQLNYLLWLRSFKVVAQAKGLWNVFIEKETVFAPPKPSDFGFEETDEVEDADDDEKPKERKPSQQIINGKIVKIDDGSIPSIDDPAKKEKTERRRTGRKSLTPAEIKRLMGSTEDTGEAQSSATVPKQSSSTPAEKQYRLALYRFNLDAWERSDKKAHQVMALLVYWVDPTI